MSEGILRWAAVLPAAAFVGVMVSCVPRPGNPAPQQPAPRQPAPAQPAVVDTEETLWPDSVYRTRVRLYDLQQLLLRFESRTGALPDGLRELELPRPVGEFARYAWGNAVLYHRHDRDFELRAPEHDATPGTADDVVVQRATPPPTPPLEAAWRCSATTGAAPPASAPGQDRTHNPAVADFLTLIPLIVEVVPARLRAEHPLLLDLRSFVLAGSSLTGDDLTREMVENAVGLPFTDVPAASAIVRRSASVYETVDNGVHVRLDGISGGSDRYSALITYQYPYGNVIGRTEVYATFHCARGRWTRVGEAILRTT